ncbi:Meckelin, partial [Orchesella cincta]
WSNIGIAILMRGLLSDEDTKIFVPRLGATLEISACVHFTASLNNTRYYYHERSVHGFADTDMQTMIEQLNREEEDLCSRRGLLPQTDQQTFLICVPNTFRNVYNQVLQPLYATSSSATPFLGRGRQLSITTSKVSLGSGNKPTANMLNLSIHAYHSMNRFLTAFLEHALSDLDYDVKDKSFFETTFDMEFSEVGSDRAVFYTDNGHSFDSVLFYGNERTLFMFNLYTFIFVDILSHNFVLAGIVTFLVDLAIKSLRNFLGKRNLARKTLIDSRFLI